MSDSTDESKTRVLIVSHILPIRFISTKDREYKVEWSEEQKDVLLTHLQETKSDYIFTYIGAPSIFVNEEDESYVENLLRPFNCIPVFLAKQTAHEHYQGFCRGVLWPLLHNVVDVYSAAKVNLEETGHSPVASSSSQHRLFHSKSDSGLRIDDESHKWKSPESWNPVSQEQCWGSFCIVNRIFAAKVVECYHERDVVWIHDYQLFMLPSYLIRKLQNANIAFFLHTPFPSSEIFRSLSMREDILRALLCTNHLGFILFEHARHFLTCCKRLLGLSYNSKQGGSLAVDYNGRNVMISCSHMATEVSYIEKKFYLPSNASSLVLSLIPTEKDKFVFSSIDPMEGLSGLSLKFLAFDQFLTAHCSDDDSSDNYIIPFVLVQIGIKLVSRPMDYAQTQKRVLAMIENINSKWRKTSTHDDVIIFQEVDHLPTIDRIALWKVTNAFVNTTVRLGCSTLPFEYILTQHLLNPSSPGQAIVSEFAAFSRVLNGSMVINPWKVRDAVDAFSKAVEMNKEERQHRSSFDMKFIRNNYVSLWATRLLRDIQASKVVDEAVTYMGMGFGFGYRVMSFNSAFMKLNEQSVVLQYHKSQQRLFIFDYGGTLSEAQSESEYNSNYDPSVNVLSINGEIRNPLSKSVTKSLQRLCDNPNNVVFVMSSASRKELEEELGFVHPKLNLISDNGYFFRKGSSCEEWECLANEFSKTSWKDITLNIMEDYVTRTNGAGVYTSAVAVVFDYHHADPEYGELQANELCDHLSVVLKNVEVDIVRGKRFVEVLPCGVNKGTAVTILTQYCERLGAFPDFILCIGDDNSDEIAFKALSTANVKSQANLNDTVIFTCTVGKKPSEAQCFVDSVDEIEGVLDALTIKASFESSCIYSQDDERGSSFQERFFGPMNLIIHEDVRLLTHDFGTRKSSYEKDLVCLERKPTTVLVDDSTEDENTVTWIKSGIKTGLALAATVYIGHKIIIPKLKKIY